MIIAKLYGGLGNQMFQYAYARNIQEKYKEELCFDVSAFDSLNSRNYSLSHFRLNGSAKIISTEDLRETYPLSYKIKLKILSLYGGGFHGETSFQRLSRHGLYITEDSCYYPFVYSNAKIKYLIGVWQSEKYFEDVRDVIKSEFVVDSPPSVENEKLMLELSRCNSVCVHIRRGDYAGNAYHEVCDEQYYNKGIELVASRTTDPVFYIFSDDVQWVIDNYDFKYPVIYVDRKNPDFEELRLMNFCNHYVVSNSSFSWWGSYLSANKNKIIVAPRKWFNSDKVTDIHLNSWVTTE